MGCQRPLSGPNPLPQVQRHRQSHRQRQGWLRWGVWGGQHGATPGLVKVEPWISTDTDLPLILSLPTKEEQLATGGMIPLSSDWIAGFTVGVSWLTGSPVPDRDPGKDLPQGRIVPGGGRRASMA